MQIVKLGLWIVGIALVLLAVATASGVVRFTFGSASGAQGERKIPADLKALYDAKDPARSPYDLSAKRLESALGKKFPQLELQPIGTAENGAHPIQAADLSPGKPVTIIFLGKNCPGGTSLFSRIQAKGGTYEGESNLVFLFYTIKNNPLYREVKKQFPVYLVTHPFEDETLAYVRAMPAIFQLDERGTFVGFDYGRAVRKFQNGGKP